MHLARTGASPDHRSANVVHEADVFDHSANRRRVPIGEPVVGVDLADGRQRDLPVRQVCRQVDQQLEIPRMQPPAAPAEVVLLAHATTVVPSAGA